LKLNDKVAVVTGGTSGIGKAIAIHYAAEGANVVVVGRNEGRANKVLHAIKTKGGNAIWIGADICNASHVKRVIDNTVDEFGKLDILVNCAGIFLTGDLENFTENDYDISMNVNLKGPFLCIKASVPVMRKQGKGKIVNISSLAGEVGFPQASIYCATKFGVIGLTKALAVELAPFKINVNSIAPGNIETPMNAHLMKNPDYVQFLLDNTPYGRNGCPDDIAPAAVYLASDDSDYVCGATLFIDGGWVAR